LRFKNYRQPGEAPIPQRSPTSAFLRAPAVLADAKRKEGPPQPVLPCCDTRSQQPFQLLEPEARLACALIEFDPRQASAPKVDPGHRALHRHVHFPDKGSSATNSLLMPEDV
jgi:hypothetical protein